MAVLTNGIPNGVTNGVARIIRTERGLSIDGARITLYDVMDFFKADYPRHAIRDQLALTDAQIDAALHSNGPLCAPAFKPGKHNVRPPDAVPDR